MRCESCCRRNALARTHTRTQAHKHTRTPSPTHTHTHTNTHRDGFVQLLHAHTANSHLLKQGDLQYAVLDFPGNGQGLHNAADQLVNEYTATATDFE